MIYSSRMRHDEMKNCVIESLNWHGVRGLVTMMIVMDWSTKSYDERHACMHAINVRAYCIAKQRKRLMSNRLLSAPPLIYRFYFFRFDCPAIKVVR
jgi:hypothetical protein